MSGIMKIIDEWERQKTKTERRKGVAEAIMKVWEVNGFVARLS